MKKNSSLYTVLIAILFGSVLPIATMAQKEIKEFYMRPSYWTPYDQRGINKFETSKDADAVPFEGLRLRLGAGFTQQFQNLKHENTALDNTATNRLYPLQNGFMTAQANLMTDVQLADGIRLNLTSYLSSRHHNETWVKGGYIQFDKLPFKGRFADKLMSIATIKIGHMEINYGDQHFRRSDGGATIQNPFMDNYIVDEFATEIGGEVLLQKNGMFGLIGLTNGMIKGHVDSTYETTTKTPTGETVVVDPNTNRNPSIYIKAGYDKTLAEKIRFRVSGSLYTNSSQAGSGLTLYGGDRTGSNYQNVMEKAPAGQANPASTGIAFSGRLNPGFSKKITAIMFNGFAKVGGAEFFGTYETAKGRTKMETEDRNMTQLAGELLYRFGKTENLYLGARYNTVTMKLAGMVNDVKADRVSVAGGWFVTKNLLMKAEYVVQNYKDFDKATTVVGSDYRSGGKFKGYVIEAVVGF